MASVPPALKGWAILTAHTGLKLRSPTPHSNYQWLQIEHSSVLPHPGPLPLGEGATSTVTRTSGRLNIAVRGRRFSLSQRERAGVREKPCDYRNAGKPEAHPNLALLTRHASVEVKKLIRPQQRAAQAGLGLVGGQFLRGALR